MQPAPYPYAPYQYNNGAPMPVRYALPNGYRQGSPPFANMAFDRYGNVAAGVLPAIPMMQPIRPRFPPNSSSTPVATPPRGATSSEALQPPTPFYYNPYGTNPPVAAPSPDTKSVASKKGAKEYKDTAFTIRPDGAEGDTIRGLVSNNDINDLLKHKGTKVKVSKIYRITKTKSEALQPDSSDEEIPLPTPKQPTSRATPAAAAAAAAATAPSTAPEPASKQRRSSSSSCSTCCSQCSCSSSDYDDRRRRSHSYDNCPECRAERERDRHRERRRRR